MITQHGPNAASFPTPMGADFSADRTHRFLLWRVWDAATPPLGFVMLNPSSADETRDDPTTVRNMARARALGYGGVVQANLYSFRTSSPAVLKRAGFPGFVTAHFANALAVARLTDRCRDVVLAWGAHARVGDACDAALFFQNLPRPPRLLHLGLLKNGMPRHPLHTAYATHLQEWS